MSTATQPTSVDSTIAKLLAFSDAGSRDRFLRRHRRLLQPAIVEKLAESVREKVRINLDEALRAAETALQIGETIGHRGAIARGLRAKANALHFLGKNKSAVELHERSIALFERESDLKEVGRTLSASILPLILLGEYDRALNAARRAQDIFTRSGDKLRLARLQINLGYTLFHQDRLAEALACYEQAYTQLLPFEDSEGIASALHNIAVCLTSLNDFRRAKTAYERARAYCEQHHMPLAVVQADYNIAYLHYLCGDYALAMHMLRATQARAEEVGDAYHAALCRLDLAEIYLELNLIKEAAEAAEEAYRRFQQLDMRCQAAKGLTSVAAALGRQGKLQQALDSLLQAREVFATERNTVWTALIDLYRAAILFNQKQYDHSRSLCVRALKSFHEAQLPNRVILCRLMLARAHLCTRKTDLAKRNCQRALREAIAVESPLLAHQAHFLMGQVHEANDDIPAAYSAYESSRQLLEALRSKLHHDELRVAFVQDRLEVYERLVDLSLRRKSGAGDEEAFRFIEEAKSRALRDLVSLQGHGAPGGDFDRESLPRIRELREALNWCYHRIELEQLKIEKGSAERLRKLQALAFEHERELSKVLRELAQVDPGFPELYASTRVTLAEIRGALRPDAALVEFFRVGPDFWGAVVTSERCEIIRVAPVRRVNELMELLRFQLSKFRLGNHYIGPLQPALLRATQAHLRELYKALLAPLRPLLRTQHLVFVPHGALHYIPFHALFSGSKYLIDSHTVSYAPSASIFALCARKTTNTSGRPLILGIPDPRASHILSEVQAISALLPGSELFVGDAATDEVLRQRGPSSTLIHIATHGYFREDNPLFSRIRLGTSYLTVLDLYQMNLPAQLVTLSGCATGMNAIAGGDELLGLVRGFLSAGSQSLLLTLWDVHDATTTLLMESFYGQLLACGDRAVALRTAMLSLREQYPHPYYWAPFFLVGKACC